MVSTSAWCRATRSALVLPSSLMASKEVWFVVRKLGSFEEIAAVGESMLPESCYRSPRPTKRRLTQNVPGVDVEPVRRGEQLDHRPVPARRGRPQRRLTRVVRKWDRESGLSLDVRGLRACSRELRAYSKAPGMLRASPGRTGSSGEQGERRVVIRAGARAAKLANRIHGANFYLDA
jgi:hypothetical protein